MIHFLYFVDYMILQNCFADIVGLRVLTELFRRYSRLKSSYRTVSKNLICLFIKIDD